MAKVFGNTENIAGGTSGALQTDFPTSVTQRVTATPKAAMVIEGDFVPASPRRRAEAGRRAQRVPVPGGRRLRPRSVVGGGDTVVMFKDNPAAEAFIEYLASPEPAEIWAKRGGFSSPNKKVATRASTRRR